MDIFQLLQMIYQLHVTWKAISSTSKFMIPIAIYAQSLHLQQHFVTPIHLHPSTQRSIGNCALQYGIIARYVWAPSVKSETHGGGRARNSDEFVYLH